ncbi:MAG: ATP synthase F1 subunit epsilon [Planctomycetota bacterium]|jgi:F-type H+-transporting ATPase subunit epsilon
MAQTTHKADFVNEDFGPQSDVEVAQGHRLAVEIRSPDGPIWSGWAESVVVPATKGSMGILPRHAPLMSSLEVGLTRVREPGGAEHRFVTGSGFVEVHRNRVLVLVDFGDLPERIDIRRAEEARERAKARLRTPQETVDRVRAEAALQRALMRLRFAGRPRV